MKLVIRIVFYIAIFFLVISCSKNESDLTNLFNHNDTVVNNVRLIDNVKINQKQKFPFLMNNEIPKIQIIDTSEDVLTIKQINQNGEAIDIGAENNPNKGNYLGGVFYSVLCGKKYLVLVIEQAVDTGISTGTRYINMLIDPMNGNLLATFEKAKIIDKETGKFISNDQKALIKRIKAGGDLGKECPVIQQPRP